MGRAAWDVSTAIVNGKLICAEATGLLPLTPADAWLALSAAEGAPIFRVERRRLREGGAPEDGHLSEEVTFAAPVRVLFWKAWARTTVVQRADLSDQENRVDVAFELVHSDLMARLEGSWRFTLVSPGDGGGRPLSRIRYSFAMWPKGVPTVLRRLPGLTEAVKAVVARESTQVLDKLAFIASKMDGPSGGCIRSALRAATADVMTAGGSFKRLASSKQGPPPGVPPCGSNPPAGGAATAAAAALQRVASHALPLGSEASLSPRCSLEEGSLGLADPWADRFSNGSSCFGSAAGAGGGAASSAFQTASEGCSDDCGVEVCGCGGAPGDSLLGGKSEAAAAAAATWPGDDAACSGGLEASGDAPGRGAAAARDQRRGQDAAADAAAAAAAGTKAAAGKRRSARAAVTLMARAFRSRSRGGGSKG